MKRKEEGISLIFIIILVAILLLVSFGILQFIHIFHQASLEKEAEEELKALYNAILGDGETTFGYHGDMGVLPYSLAYLVVRDAQPAAAPGSFTGQIVGWKGPYYHPKRWDGRNILDPFGNPYVQRITSSGGQYYWQLLSAGRDGIVGTSDDITIRPPIRVLRRYIYYYVPSSVYASIKIGNHSGIENQVFVTFFPFFGTETYSINPLGSEIIQDIPAGKRMVWAFIYLNISPYYDGSSCGYYAYRPAGIKHVNFPLEKPGRADFNWQSDAEIITYQVSCFSFWWYYFINVRLRTSLTWDPPSCSPDRNGVSLWLMTPTFSSSPGSEISYDSLEGAFVFWDLKFLPFFPIRYFIVSNSGKNIYVTVYASDCL